MTSTDRLRQLLAGPDAFLAPTVYDALSARIIAQAGFPAVFVSGFGVAASRLGMPDTGLISFGEMIDQLRGICGAVPGVPVIADADTGFGNAMNVRRTFLEYARAGASCVMIEDQVSPKRCGHFEGKSVVPAEEMLYRLQAALDARTDPNFLIIARTDARGPEGFDRALERAHRYMATGVDALFFEAPSSAEELRRVGEAFPGVPLVANMVERSRTPLLHDSELKAMGYHIILYANAALYLGAFAIRAGLKVLREQGTTESLLDRMMSFQERQTLIGLAQADAYERDLVERVRKQLG